MIEKFYKLVIALLASIPIHKYVMPVLLQYVYTPSFLGQILMYIMISIVLYELLITYRKWKKWDRNIMTFIYYITLIYILFAREDMGYAFFELDPHQLVNSIRYGSYDEWIVAIFNVLIFIPMPIFNQFYIKDPFRNTVLCVSSGVLIEFIQAVSHRGVFDVGDIILYCAGILIGCFMRKKLK